MNRHSYKDGAMSSSESATDDGCSTTSIDPAAIEAALRGQPSEASSSAIVAIFDALADPTRLRIVHALISAELCVCDLAEVCGISQSGVSHQLRLLRERHLVAFTRDGKRAVYRLADDHVRALVGIALEHANERTEAHG